MNEGPVTDAERYQWLCEHPDYAERVIEDAVYAWERQQGVDDGPQWSLRDCLNDEIDAIRDQEGTP